MIEVKKEIISPGIAGIKKGHLELYKYMKDRYENGEQFKKDDLMEIYNRFVVPSKRPSDAQRLTEEQLYNNASQWLNRSISVLVRRGYLGLTFKKDLKKESSQQFVERIFNTDREALSKFCNLLQKE